MATTTSISLSSLDGSNGFRLDSFGYYFQGFSLSSAGDMNGDGFDDVAIGTSLYRYFDSSSYVVFGKASGFDASMYLQDLDGENGFQVVVAVVGAAINHIDRAGDINGDGFDDVVVSESSQIEYEYYTLTVNKAYVVFGKSDGFSARLKPFDLDGTDGFGLEGGAAHKFLNAIVSGAGDVNGDGFDDFIVGNSDDPGSNSLGSSYVVFGKPSGFGAVMSVSDLDGVNGFRLDGVAAYDESGRSVNGAGDVNGDGFDDVIIGARGADPNGENSGSSYVVFGKASGFDAAMSLSALDGSNGFRLDGMNDRGFSGNSVSSAGDVNGDGFNDVLVSDGNYWDVVFGKATGFGATMNLSALDGSNGFHLDGSGLVVSASPAGDVNGDGFDDVIVGVPYADLNGDRSGSSYVMFGRASGFDATIKLSDLDSTNSVRLDGVAAGDRSGASVSGAGDVNNDGFDDLIVGAPGADLNGNNSGSSYVIFGRSDFTGGDVVDFPGTPGDDNFTGTRAAERFEGGAGDDRMIGRGGADWFDGGAGNDYIRISDDSFEWADGGSGIDILGLAGSGFNLDLSSVIDKIHGIETISLYGIGDNSLSLTAQDVLNLSNETDMLKIKGNAGDSVTGLSSGWTDGGVHGNFHTYTHGDAVLLVGVDVATDFAA